MSVLFETTENEAAKLSGKPKLWSLFSLKSENRRQEEDSITKGEEVMGRSRKGAGEAIVLAPRETSADTISDSTLCLIMDRFSPC
ncbi:hypothetical protein MLD38_023355 [Melastoma candidum]|uniref:Uncharacterized protein n=1 Tax=Melastoma candidum TaxID=119954 RepID=A0ACB9QVF5_9MYRT|nr:hypothetical protein MLD38_023355 [Melastoma candidum]